MRALLFLLCQLITTPLYVLMMMISSPFSKQGPRYFSGAWCRLMLRLGTVFLGVRYTVNGWENLPDGPCVVLVKHQSAWETMFFPAFFPPHCFVMKQEILSIPFFGWGMRLLNPIAINRDARREAFQQVKMQGMERLGSGLKVIIFPEGTRGPSGYRGRYAPSGGLLAVAAGVPVVPMAHNAGEFWKKGLFAKHRGTISVRIGPAISTTGLDGAAVTAQAEAWIEDQMKQMTGRVAQPYQRRARNAAALKGARAPRRHRIVIGARELHYTVARRQRRRNISLMVDHDGLTVAIPTWVTLQSVEEAIREQWPWVEKKLDHWEQRALPEPPQFKDGEALPWLGGARILRLTSRQLSLLPMDDEGVIEIDPERGPVSLQVMDWYRAQALPLLESRVQIFAHQLGIAPPPVRLSNALGRWGSCNSNGEIRLSWRLLKASMAEIDYVVAHEVAHLRHLNHSGAFWQLVGNLYPDYKQASKLLDSNDPIYRHF